jgi:asparagine synthetase B (glutamine-hydrolysing)
MTDSLVHRGHDNINNYISNHYILGHNRRAIIDINTNANQPFTLPNKPYHLVFNGEIYNYLELKKELIDLNHHFETNSDTDVVQDEISHNIFASPIFKIDTSKYNCIITPHIAGATYDSMAMTEVFIANKLLKNV